MMYMAVFHFRLPEGSLRTSLFATSDFCVWMKNWMLLGSEYGNVLKWRYPKLWVFPLKKKTMLDDCGFPHLRKTPKDYIPDEYSQANSMVMFQ